MDRAKKSLCEDVEQYLLETIADFLDSEHIKLSEVLSGYGDPEPPEKTELHIRMAKAAMQEYEKTIQR